MLRFGTKKWRSVHEFRWLVDVVWTCMISGVDVEVGNILDCPVGWVVVYCSFVLLEKR